MPLRDYQQDAVNSLFAYFKQNRETGNPLVVAPTGSGKSHVIAGFIEQVLQRKPHVRFLVCAHRQELIEQNSSKLNPFVPQGIYSAGLRSKAIAQVTFATIGSVYRRAREFAGTQILIIDEAHLVPNKGAGMYLTLIKQLGCRVVGLTATPYRLDSGHLVNTHDEANIFTDIVHDIDMTMLIDRGVLAPIVTKCPSESVNTEQIHIKRGEFDKTESQDFFMAVIEEQAAEIIRRGRDRRSWLIFCSGVTHSEKMAEILNANGVPAMSVTGDTADRSIALSRFKSGEVRALTNCDVLTTGFDAPCTDLLALLRPTQSTGLYVQMVGRGMRPAEGKENCLLLDFGGNVERHGPIDDVRPASYKERDDDLQLVRICKVCRGANNIRAEFCSQCGADFLKTCRGCGCEVPLRVAKTLQRCPQCNCYWNMTRDPGGVTATERAALSMYKTHEADWFDVTEILFNVHKKPGSPNSLRVTYYADVDGRIEIINKFVCLEHGGYATKVAIQWVYMACPAAYREEMTDVNTIEELYRKTSLLKTPRRIKAERKGKYWEVKGYEYPTDEEWGGKKEQEETEEWNDFVRDIFN